jgi:hypothetical protein
MALHGRRISRGLWRRFSSLRQCMIERKAVLEAMTEFFAENFPNDGAAPTASEDAADS